MDSETKSSHSYPLEMSARPEQSVPNRKQRRAQEAVARKEKKVPATLSNHDTRAVFQLVERRLLEFQQGFEALIRDLGQQVMHTDMRSWGCYRMLEETAKEGRVLTLDELRELQKVLVEEYNQRFIDIAKQKMAPPTPVEQDGVELVTLGG